MVERGDSLEQPLKIDLIPPVSTMLEASFTRTARAKAGAQNSAVELPQALSLFLGEEITPNVGTFLQVTYTAADRAFAMDNADIRYANHARVGSKEIIYGVSLNNNPTVQDVWNGTPAWGFPFAASSVAPAPAAATLVDGPLAQRVAGLGAYALWDNRIYAELSGYRSAPQGGPHPPDATAVQTVRGVAPYWRAALQHGWRRQYLEIGAYGLSAALYPRGVSGPTDRYRDVALDAQYERRVGGGNVTAHTTWIHERQELDASFAAGDAANPSNTLSTFRIDGSYYTAARLGLTAAYFSTTGDADVLRYPGSVTGSPNSDGVIAELAYLPWLNTRFTLQYVAYGRFDGARNTSENNTLYLLVWLAF
jgi:hypothetical protein